MEPTRWFDQSDAPSQGSTNLPMPLTSFVGRANELADVARLLATTRLLTVVGAGGGGKTRLAFEVARRALGVYRDGVWCVELAPLADAAIVADAVASAFGLRQTAERSSLELLVDYLRTRQLLLVLDNCEHLVSACASLATKLLQTCPLLRILATSRESLRVDGEIVWPIPPLSLPPADSPPLLGELAGYEAIQLFVQRAAAVQPVFQLNDANARAVAQICYRLDGIPLAIELAAARMTLLSADQIAARLDDRFHLLTGGSRTALPRHQTLRATIDWSLDLVTEPERVLLRRLAVFAGGFTLEHAETICNDTGLSPVNVLEALSHLADRSLVVVERPSILPTHNRYRLLETIRQYGSEMLAQAGETVMLQQRHLDVLTSWVERTAPELRGDAQVELLAQWSAEIDNLREAFDFALRSHVLEPALRLATELATFWDLRGSYSEGRRWLNEVLQRQDELNVLSMTELWGRALLAAGMLACRHGDNAGASERLAVCLDDAVRRGDTHVAALARLHLGTVELFRGETGRAQHLLEQSAAQLEALGDRRSQGEGLRLLGMLAWEQEDDVLARLRLEQSVVLFRELGDVEGLATALNYLGELLRLQGDFDHATALYQQCGSLFAKLGSIANRAMVDGNLGSIAFAQGDLAHAAVLIFRCLDVSLRLHGNQRFILAGLVGLGAIARAHGELELAARMLGAAQSYSALLGLGLNRADGAQWNKDMAALRRQLPAHRLERTLAEGRPLAPAAAVALAADGLAPLLRTASLSQSASGGGRVASDEAEVLTPREREVLGLIAQGLTDAQIAERLVLSPRTVSKHVQSIYGKLSLTSRSGATRFAITHGLAR